MKPNPVPTGTSLLSILLMSFHLTQDSLHARPGSWDAGPANLVVIGILLVWLCGTVLLAGTRSGHAITLLGGLFAAGMPVLHLSGAGPGETARSSGAFFFLWTMIALGVTGMFSVILAAHALWTMQRPQGAPTAPHRASRTVST